MFKKTIEDILEGAEIKARNEKVAHENAMNKIVEDFKKAKNDLIISIRKEADSLLKKADKVRTKLTNKLNKNNDRIEKANVLIEEANSYETKEFTV